jgi:hypothetical protein
MSTRDEIVTLVSLTDYELNGWRIVIRFPEGTRTVLFSKRQTLAMSIQYLIQWAPGALPPRIKKLWREAKPLSLYSIPKSRINRAIISLPHVPSS